MPKNTLRRQKSLKHFTFINSNVSDHVDNSNLNNETNFNGNNYNNLFINLKPAFPSTITTKDLIKTANTNNKPKWFPNAFIAYRMALVREFRIKNCKLPSMGEVSKIAKNFWNMEPKNVKDFYEALVKEAKSTYKKNNIQILLDKHMDYTEQGSDVTEKQLEKVNPIHNSVASAENNNNAGIPTVNISLVNSLPDIPYEINSTLNNREYPIHNSVASAENNNNAGIPTANISLVNSLPDIPYELNSTLNDREYIKVLEQIIANLIGSHWQICEHY
ncbi:uncharacterized protein OCT59_023660 [Rhizophagus irregularis]|uniref:HMG box domain-containing protein n=2 Tax=Rhizophagus irregularis TaxID=588596 RepID=U9SPZ5_RHIID|nr:hypothetical protein GLOIN_2v1777451 [Rhizophagus irregularis DAOM 181602=DAOM 197198]EXX58597.1 hypothetical protein RirG_196500 [Rhizophagus irregularis DAOM 197198w]UZO03252.1 hypothetical protein OCT59_023660 [Rhizophagus irregularis]POG69209.1 hypothetical protein GLOIN_2v1777451 [Rhizophagus irregularis DAOM 181602=DAOM 197198]CAG8445596.1 2526_t:CDS:1 [Rhizophagus irregularis]GBC20635.1 hypothetical protein GLOIN_2v1777451 [Rhizophagus irregularis DAOM 181602=DAOM 197198]|eukprot:XP_025176075.1 hypothetical protein GLOIN_2v1777451 [Rhizophagus irregularis DAOM 181602=DAOM 197198]